MIQQRLATDPHSPNEFRCNQIVRNLDDFYDAFDVTESDALWLDEPTSASRSGDCPHWRGFPRGGLCGFPCRHGNPSLCMDCNLCRV